MKDVRIIVTGGTIDKIHDTRSEGLAFAPDGATHIPELLRIGRCHFPTVELLMLKDSLLFDDTDRQAIASAVTNPLACWGFGDAHEKSAGDFPALSDRNACRFFKTRSKSARAPGARPCRLCDADVLRCRRSSRYGDGRSE